MTHLAAARRVSWGFADQALSSLTNFAVGVLVARSVNAEDFGAFSTAFVTYTLALITSRALASEPFIVRHSATDDASWRAATRGSSGMSLIVGIASATVIAVCGLAIGGPLGISFVSLAVVLPGLLVQDMWRFAFIAHGRGQIAFLIDLLWLALLVPGFLVVQAASLNALIAPMIVWGGAAGIAAVAAHAIARSTPSFTAARRWWTAQRDLGARYVAEALIGLGAAQLSAYALVTFGGLAAAGALRGSQILLGPILVLLMGIGVTAIPEGVRLLHRGGPSSLRGPAIVISVLVAGFSLIWGWLVHDLPPSVGASLLGDTWPSAAPLLVPLAISYAVNGFGLGAGTGLRVLADARRSLRGRAVLGVAQAIGGVMGAYQAGALGTIIGWTIGGAIGILALWVLFLASVRSHGTEEPTPWELDRPAPTPGSPML